MWDKIEYSLGVASEFLFETDKFEKILTYSIGACAVVIIVAQTIKAF